MFGQGADHLRGEIRDLVRFTGRRAPDECQGVGDAFGDGDAELGQEPPDHVDELGATVTRRPSGSKSIFTSAPVCTVSTRLSKRDPNPSRVGSA